MQRQGRRLTHINTQETAAGGEGDTADCRHGGLQGQVLIHVNTHWEEAGAGGEGDNDSRHGGLRAGKDSTNTPLHC